MKYVALLRGIGPGNPNMRNEKLRGVMEGLGFTSVKTIISSGNVVFETDSTDIEALEKRLEKAWPEQLGFTSVTILRSQQQLETIVGLNPYKGYEHGATTYLLTTFFKRSTKLPFKIPYQPDGKPYKFIAATSTELFSVTDTTTVATTDLMTWLDKQFGKEISSRTWKTVNRILDKIQAV